MLRCFLVKDLAVLLIAEFFIRRSGHVRRRERLQDHLGRMQLEFVLLATAVR